MLLTGVQYYFDKKQPVSVLMIAIFPQGEEMKLMKSCLFQKKYLLAGMYIILVLFTCCNARFYHTPLAKICSVTEKQTLSREGTRGSKEYYYTQNITARILNGVHKGEKIKISNEYTSSQVQTKKYHKGDTVLLSGCIADNSHNCF